MLYKLLLFAAAMIAAGALHTLLSRIFRPEMHREVTREDY